MTPEVSVLDVASGTIVKSLQHNDCISAIAISPDGSLLATATNELLSVGEITIWDTTKWTKIHTIRAHLLGILSLAFAPDTGLLYSGSMDASIRCWNPKTGEIIGTITGSKSPIGSLAFSRDGATLAAGCWNQTISLWNPKNRTLLRSLPKQSSRILNLDFSPDSRYLVSACDDGSICLLTPDKGRKLLTWLAISSDDGWPHIYTNEEIAQITNESIRKYIIDNNNNLITFRNTQILTGAIRATDVPLWVAVTPEGYYTCSDGIERYVKWKFGKEQLYPFYQFEETFRRPDLVRKALKREVITEKPITLERIPPRCRFISPEQGSAVTDDIVRVIIEGADDIEVTNLKLLVNGIPMTANAKGLTVASKPIAIAPKELDSNMKVSKLFTVDIPLPTTEQEITIRAIIYDNEQNKADAILTLRRTKVSPVQGNLFALYIGVSEYRNPNYNLTFAEADATALAKLFASQEGKQYAHVYNTVLTNNKATISNIRKALITLKQAKIGDTVFLFLSGHGVQSNERFYFAPYGVVINDIENTCIPWQEVIDTLSHVSARRLLFTDACHAGTKLGANQATSSQLASLTRQSGIVMLASSQGDEFSFEDASLKHGIFTAALLEAFDGAADVNADNSITLPELEIYVPNRVSILSKKRQNPHLVSVQDFNPQIPLVKIKNK
jgi:hypothetical protein